MTSRSAARWAVGLSVPVAIAAMIVAALSARHLEILWDEQVDRDIAIGLAADPLFGERPLQDASQLRLPMYLNGAAFVLTGRTDLATSRLVSLLAGGVTILGAAAVAGMLFGTTAGVLAAVLLGGSPYFLGFARISMTEGDVFFACFTTLAVWAFLRYLQRATAGRWVLAAILLGLAIGAKFFGIFLLLVFAVMTASTGPSHDIELDARPSRVRRLHRWIGGGLIAVAACLVLSALGDRPGGWATRGCVGVWLIGLACWVAAVVSSMQRGALAASRMRRLAAMFGLAILTCAVVLPVHCTRHEVIVELMRRTLRWDHRVPLALWSDHLRLYSGIVLTKQSIPLGVLTAMALVFAAFREQGDGRWRASILCVIFYVTLLCFLPLRQAFYLMGVYPLIMVLVAGFVVEMGRRLYRWSRVAGRFWLAAVLLLLVHLGYRVDAAYPWFHLAGRDIVGDRWMGAESRGYRNLIQTPSDGVAEMIQWCIADPRVAAGDRVISYLWEDRIIENLLPVRPRFDLVRRGVQPDRDALPAVPPIDEADFVLLHINNLLGYGDRPPDLPPMDELRDRFEVVHVVHRDGLDVGWVYQRKR